MDRLRQSIFSVLVDLAFLAAVCFLGFRHIVEGQAVVILLGAFGGGRVYVGATKERARIAASSMSGEMRAVDAIVRSRDDDDDGPPGAPRAGGSPVGLPRIAPPRARPIRREDERRRLDESPSSPLLAMVLAFARQPRSPASAL